MRGPPRTALPSLGDHGFDDLDHVPAGTTPERLSPSGTLKPAREGAMTSDQRVFTATVHADGSVDLTDAPSVRFRWTPSEIRRMGSAWYADADKPVGSLDRGGSERGQRDVMDDVLTRDLEDARRHMLSKRGADPMETVFNKLKAEYPMFELDWTDFAMRRFGDDPYASKKLQFLDSTRAERVHMGARFRREQLAMASQRMQRNLERLWTTVPDPIERKRLVFELWDDCAESGPADLIEAGAAARAMVVGFILARLPRGSATGYTNAELVELNRTRRSTAMFAPYE
jgi:hypothetical protein